MRKQEIKGPIGIVGLGYVGLPLAVAFAREIQVVGFDINKKRIESLKAGRDETRETTPTDLRQKNLAFTYNPVALRKCPYIIVAVPTPVDEGNDPDLGPVRSASEIVGKNLKPGTTVIFESTVYPGVTEEVCLPILEKFSGLKLGQFKIGYSPERINPGDREHTIDKVIKVVSGCDAETLDRVAKLYLLVAKAGVHRAANIKTAEAAKVIENVQRDLNIALMNELSQIFAKLGISTHDVINAAATKWNFQRFTPGLVGGHCIGVDPYYLTHRALQLGIHPRVILAGRSINDSMGKYVGELTVKALNEAGKILGKSTVLVLGLTFKENVPDIRNSKVLDVIKYLREFNVDVIGCDPLLTSEAVHEEFGVRNVDFAKIRRVDAVVLANRHKVFETITLQQLKKLMTPPILVDLKCQFRRADAEALKFIYRSL